MYKSIPFGRKSIGQGFSVYVIAEIGVNHEGNVEVCAKMIEAAANSGANAIKLQTSPPDENYIRGTESHALFSRCELTKQETAQMFHFARGLGLDPFTTSPDPQTLAWVDALEPAGHKISSGMMTNPIIIRETCKTGRSILMSTGLANEENIRESVGWIEKAGAGDRLGLFQCTSLYPAKPEEMNLSRIKTLLDAYGVPVGLSDHSSGTQAAMLGVAAGACMVEKHFTLDAARDGYDHRLSLTPAQFKGMVENIRLAEIYMGNPVIEVSEEIAANRDKFLRCLFARRPIKIGDTFTSDNISLKRPMPDNRGLGAEFYDNVIGKKSTSDLMLDEPIKEEHVSDISVVPKVKC